MNDDFARNVELFNSMTDDQRMQLLVKRTKKVMRDEINKPLSPILKAAKAVSAIISKVAWS